MFSLDDRAGNVITTLLLFIVAVIILYLAWIPFLILLLSIFFAFLVEPAVSWVQNRSPLGRHNRRLAILQVYVSGLLLLGGLAYEVGPRVVAQAKNLSASISATLRSHSDGTSTPGGVLTATQQIWIREQLARHEDFITGFLGRSAASAGTTVANSIWLLAIPILAVFVLKDGRYITESLLAAAEPRRSGPRLRRIIERVDQMLARYVRAQLALSGLSFVFYSSAMLALRFPYAIALGALGGALEFLPAVGWIAAAALILTTGFLTHTHWIWMVVFLIVWRFVQNYVNSPRIMENSLELQPLTVVFALMVGAQVGGIAGIYLSVPTVAALRIVWLECFPPPETPAASPRRSLQQVKA